MPRRCRSGGYEGSGLRNKSGGQGNGRRGRRSQQQKEEAEEDSWFMNAWLNNIVEYGPQRNRKTFYERNEEKKPGGKERCEKKKERKPKPSTTIDKLVGKLVVEHVDLCIPDNTKKHNTDLYACTDQEKDPELVCRRGGNIRMVIKFNRPYNKELDDLKLFLKLGEWQQTDERLFARILLDESGKSNFKAMQWGATLVSSNKESITVDLHIHAGCAIGQWDLSIKTFTKDCPDEKLKYNHNTDIFILFNPWCEDDPVYMKDEGDRSEYVLNDNHAVFQGNAYSQQGKPWFCGQFEEEILDICLDVILDGIRGKRLLPLCDPVKVVRLISQKANNCDDGGVLAGRWHKPYDDGTSPTAWNGSVKILREYARTGQPVKYGQCWVFSGLVTSICRAVGIGCRSVTNFASAHDTDKSVTIDDHWEEDTDGTLEEYENGSDSIWNFHVWNEVYLKRLDLMSYHGKYDGWQVIDATPQERSDGIYKCGPCPVAAIKEGDVRVPFDCEFIFAEVNADKVSWKRPKGSKAPWKRFEIRTDVVGKNISTKVADGEAYEDNFWSFMGTGPTRQLLDDRYKYPEGSAQNTAAVLRAASKCRNPKDAYTGALLEDRDIKFTLKHKPCCQFGKPVLVKLKAINRGKNPRTIQVPRFRFYSATYESTQSMQQLRDHVVCDSLTLQPGAKHKFVYTLDPKEYCRHIESENNLTVKATALVTAQGENVPYSIAKTHQIEVIMENLGVEAPNSVEKGREFPVVVTINNPTDDELTDCHIDFESGGFLDRKEVFQEIIPPHGKLEKTLQLTGKRAREKPFMLNFTFNSKQLKNIKGTKKIYVK